MGIIVTDAYWEAALVGGKPLICGGTTWMEGWCLGGAVIEFVPHVEVDEDPMSPIEELAWYIRYADVSGSRYVTRSAGVPPGPITLTSPRFPYQDGKWAPQPLAVELYGLADGQEPPYGTKFLTADIVDSDAFFDPQLSPPSRYRGGGEWRCAACPSGGSKCNPWEQLGIIGEAGEGFMAAFFDLPVFPVDDPNAIQAAFTYVRRPELGRHWTFSAVPRPMSLANPCTTAESPPRDLWEAGCPAASGGTTRTYFSDADDGGFVPQIGYGTQFTPLAVGYSEKIGAATVEYDSSGRVKQVRDAGAVHDYSYPSSTLVQVLANTYPATKMICTHSDLKVSSVSVQAFIEEIDEWVTVGEATVAWDTDLITSISLSPNGTTTHFRYYDDGSLWQVEACDGSVCEYTYHEEAAS